MDYKNRAGEHDWLIENSTEDGGLYFAKYAYVGQGWIFLRIYRKGDERVLAERLYLYLDKAKFYWSKDLVVYDTAGGDIPHDGVVALPPTRLDRLLTYIP